MNDIQVLNKVKVTHIIDFLKNIILFFTKSRIDIFLFSFKEDLVFMILVIGQNNAPDPSGQTNVGM